MSMRTILVIDDEAAFLTSCQHGLARQGDTVHVALNAAAGLRLAERHRPDVAVADLRIGADWGIDVIRALKMIRYDMRVLLVSGYLSLTAIFSALRAGAEDVIPKPVKPSELFRRIITERASNERDGRDEPPPTLAQAKFEHASRIFVETGGNLSEAARLLGIHRQSLQRELKKPK